MTGGILKIGDIIFENIEIGGLIEVYVADKYGEYRQFLINEEEAKKIITHLKDVFCLNDEKAHE